MNMTPEGTIHGQMPQCKAMPAGMPDVSPMLAETCPGPFDDSDWLYEIKWDGYRCLLYIKDSDIFLRSRNGNSLNSRFPRLESIVHSVRHSKATNLIVDGEIVAFRNGSPSFSYLKANPDSAVYVAFDLVYLNGQFLIQMPLVKRRDLLLELFSWEGIISYSESHSGKGSVLFNFALERDLEGVMAKRKDSLYFPGKRTHNWLKIRNFKEEEFWVLGYLPSPGREIGSLVVGREVQHKASSALSIGTRLALPDTGSKDMHFTVVGRVSSGLNTEMENEFLAAFGLLKDTKELCIQGKLPKNLLRSVRWIEPYFGVQVQYTEITPEGSLRHPVLRGIVGMQ